ncbi:MAG: protein translocase subunit SecD [Angustibacter sp.]
MSGPKSRGPRPLRPILALLALLVILGGIMAAQVQWAEGQWTPRRGLDLAGGTQIVLEPVLADGAKLPPGALAQSRDIIENRVNGSGVTEAEITTANDENVVVAIPGPQLSERQRKLITASSQLRFRAVLLAAPATPISTGLITPSITPSGKASVKPSGKPSDTAKPSASTTKPAANAPSGQDQRAIPKEFLRAEPSTPATPAAPNPTAPAVPNPTAPALPTTPGAPTGVDPQGQVSLPGVTEEQQKDFASLTCADTAKLQGGADDPKKPLVTCSQDRTEKYILGPVEVPGDDIEGATSGLQATTTGGTSTTWEVQLDFSSAGAKKFLDVTTRLYPQAEPQNRFGIVLDGLVISAPRANEPISGGRASITGNFTQQTSKDLAESLKYGALPLTFKKQTEEQISPLLGSEQLQRGLLAGLIGLILVVVYSLFQYRALGLVTVSSLLIAGGLTYQAVVLLGNSSGLSLTLAGVTGLIVSIGVTADSFIVYFERVRDEVRDGRSLRSAVETGWRRARRTILAADAINFLAAIVLYVLAAGGVRGFAFTLGLATIIDVIVVMLFTHPLLTLLARTKFFGQGHRLSGLDRRRLGAGAPVGLKAQLGTIASRRAATPTPQDA